MPSEVSPAMLQLGHGSPPGPGTPIDRRAAAAEPAAAKRSPIPAPPHRKTTEKPFFMKQLFSPLPVTERASPVNGRSRVRAGVIARAHASPVQLYGDMVFVPLVQEDSAVFICSDLGGSALPLAGRTVTQTYFITRNGTARWRVLTTVYFPLMAVRKYYCTLKSYLKGALV